MGEYCFDIFYPQPPPASNSAFIVFIAGFLHDAEQRSKRSGEEGAMVGGWAQAEGVGTRGMRAGLRTGDTMAAVDD